MRDCGSHSPQKVSSSHTICSLFIYQPVLQRNLRLCLLWFQGIKSLLFCLVGQLSMPGCMNCTKAIMSFIALTPLQLFNLGWLWVEQVILTIYSPLWAINLWHHKKKKNTSFKCPKMKKMIRGVMGKNGGYDDVSLIFDQVWVRTSKKIAGVWNSRRLAAVCVA